MTVPDEVLSACRRARRIVVLTGAGMSAESGLATFRQPAPPAGHGRATPPREGLWSQFRPEELATPEAWRADRDLVWAWYQWRTRQVLQAEPNAGHHALARWPVDGTIDVVTQNVDDLHERGGSRGVLHLHGSLLAPRCEDCGAAADVAVLDEEIPERLPPPRCHHCRAAVRPGVVWFGEAVPAIDAAVDLVRGAEVLLVVGTSGVVHPAAGLADLALGAGARVVEINPEALEQEGRVAWRITAAVGLPELVDALGR